MAKRGKVRMYARPHIWIEPGLRFGRPVVAGTGLEVQFIADRYWALGYDETVPAYGLPRSGLLLAAWWVAEHGREGSREMRAAFAAWAKANWEGLWRGDYETVPLPPVKGE